MDFKDKVKDVWDKTTETAGKAYKTAKDKSQKMVKQNLDFHSFFVVEKSPWKIY